MFERGYRAINDPVNLEKLYFGEASERIGVFKSKKPAISGFFLIDGARTRNRTKDTGIFNPALPAGYRATGRIKLDLCGGVNVISSIVCSVA